MYFSYIELTLFNVILKVAGIFFIKDALTFLLQLFAAVIYLKPENSFSAKIDYFNLTGTFFIFLACVAIIYLLIFKTEFIIDLLGLDKKFGKEIIDLNIHRSIVLSISIMVVGGLILVNEIPNFINQINFYFLDRNILGKGAAAKRLYLILSGSKIFVGGLLITYQNQIVNFIELRRKREKE